MAKRRGKLATDLEFLTPRLARYGLKSVMGLIETGKGIVHPVLRSRIPGLSLIPDNRFRGLVWDAIGSPNDGHGGRDHIEWNFNCLQPTLSIFSTGGKTHLGIVGTMKSERALWLLLGLAMVTPSDRVDGSVLDELTVCQQCGKFYLRRNRHKRKYCSTKCRWEK